MYPVKLARVAPAVSHLAHDRSVVAEHRPDHIVLAVIDKKKLLVLIH